MDKPTPEGEALEAALRLGQQEVSVKLKRLRKGEYHAIAEPFGALVGQVYKLRYGGWNVEGMGVLEGLECGYKRLKRSNTVFERWLKERFTVPEGQVNPTRPVFIRPADWSRGTGTR